MKEAEAKEGEKVKKTIVVSIMPCTAKKAEIKRKENYTEGKQDVDFVLTTDEVIRMIKEFGINLATIQGEAMDMPFGLASGAGSIFGVTGGVTEAVIRNLVGSSNYADIKEISMLGVRGDDEFKEAEVRYGDRTLKIAIVNGLKNADELMNRIESGEAYYDFVEVMACRRGCIAGGGQPTPIGPTTKKARLEGLYSIDSASQIKISGENPIVKDLYGGILKGKEHKLLHSNKEA